MTATRNEPPAKEGVLLEHFLEVDAPNGYRVELIDGEIFVTGVPVGRHEHSIATITGQILRHCSVEFHVSFRLGLVVPGPEGFPDNHVSPDCMLVPAARRAFRGGTSWMRPDDLSMVVEVTGSRPERDREAKRYGYARASIPLYLLVDLDEQRITLFSDPHDGDYRHMRGVACGKPLALPEPFDIELDTSRLV